MSRTRANEDIVYTLVVDAQGAQSVIQSTKQELMGAEFGATKLGKALDDLGGKAGRDVTNGMRSLQFALGGVSSQAAQTLGILGDMADLVMLGSPIVLGIGALAAGVYGVHYAWKASQESATVFKDAVKAIGPVMTDFIERQLQPARDGIKSMAEELRNFGKDARQQLIDDTQGTLEMLEGNLERLKANRYKEQRQRDQIKFGFVEGDLDLQQDVVDRIETRIRELQVRADEARTNVETLTRQALELDAKAANAKAAEDAAKGGGEGPYYASMRSGRLYAFAEAARNEAQAEQQANLAAGTANFQNAVRMAQLHRDNLMRLEQERHDHKMRLINEEAERMQALHEREAASFAQLTSVQGALAQGLVSSTLGASQVLMEGLITHQKDAFQQAASVFLKSTGSQLIGLGTKIGFEGAELTLLGAPNGPLLLGLGAAAVATGFAMGGVGLAIAPKGAGTAAGAAPKTSGGVNRGAGAGNPNGELQTVQVNIYRGVYGPPADRDAAAVVEAIKHAKRSGRLAGVV